MLMVTWSGERERQGQCPSLSAYIGSSQLWPAIHARLGLTQGEVGRASESSRIAPAFRDRLVRSALKRGKTCRWIMRHVHCSNRTIQRVRHTLPQ